MNNKDINVTQLELFDDLKEVEKLEKKQVEKEKIKKEKLALQHKVTRQKKIKQEEQKEEERYRLEKKYFYKALKKTKKYLSWGRISPKLKKSNYFSTLPTIFFSEDIDERENWKYELWYERKNLTTNIHIDGEERIFEIKWTLPLFEEAMGYIAHKYMIYPGLEDFQQKNFIDFEEDNEMYEEFIDSCRNLLDPEVNDDYFLKGVEFSVKKTFKKIYYNKLEDFNLIQPENLESMSLSQEKNVLTFQWELPDEILKIRLADHGEFSACFKYWLQ